MTETEEYYLYLTKQNRVDIDESSPNHGRYDPLAIGTERFTYEIRRRQRESREAREELRNLFDRPKQVCKQNLPKTFTFEDRQEETYIYDKESDGYGNILMVITETEEQMSEVRHGWVSRKLPLNIKIGYYSELRFELARNPWHSKALVNNYGQGLPAGRNLHMGKAVHAADTRRARTDGTRATRRPAEETDKATRR